MNMQIVAAWVNGSRAYDVLNRDGYWIAWVKADANGTLRLMSTGAPLTDEERETLAGQVACAIDSRVVA